MSSSYNLSKQKQLNNLEVLDQNRHVLQNRVLNPPCISIEGFNNLNFSALSQFSSVDDTINNIIQKLFLQLNIPYAWIHSIKSPDKIVYSNKLPSTVNIYLVTDDIKIYVQNSLYHYFKKTYKKSVTVKLMM
jgi:hypothetical protein